MPSAYFEKQVLARRRLRSAVTAHLRMIEKLRATDAEVLAAYKDLDAANLYIADELRRLGVETREIDIRIPERKLAPPEWASRPPALNNGDTLTIVSEANLDLA